jgi:Ca2+-transporting ATPase
LWINLVTDGMPALALVMDPPDSDVMTRPPRPPTEPILGRSEWIQVLTIGVMETAVTLGTFVWALHERNLTEARNLAFTVLVFSEVLRSFAARSTTKIFWQVGAFSNLVLLGVVTGSVLIQIAIHHMPFTEHLFDIGSMSLADCLLSLVIGLVPVTVIEVGKLLRAHERRAGGAS